MPFVLLVFGAVLVVAGVRGKTADLFTMLKSDFTGTNSFVPWVVAIGAIGAAGYVKPIKPITDAMLLLVIIVLFLSNGGFFQKFLSQTGAGQ